MIEGEGSRTRGYKFFLSMLNSTEYEISTAHGTKMLKKKTFPSYNFSDSVFIMLINVKLSMINYVFN